MKVEINGAMTDNVCKIDSLKTGCEVWGVRCGVWGVGLQGCEVMNEYCDIEVLCYI